MHDAFAIESRYQILRTIASGGMGVVYLVVDARRANQIMALKTLKSLHDDQAAENFRAEFRSIRGVLHPHIPEVYDFGALPPDQGGYYFTCEFVDGKPLDQLIKQWSPEQLRVVLVGLCRALAFLHSRGLLHRDIKPGNVLGRLSPNGEFAALKLVDFGLAGGHDDEVDLPGGTLDYMAPELLAHAPATIATDLYALGMLMYRLATGRLPFDGQDAIANSQSRSRAEAPHPLRFRPDLPIGLADVIAALVHTNPKDRPASARHTIAMLNERDGVNFAYETAETRRAYISSSGMVTNHDVRDQLVALRELMKSGEQPPNILISARAGLGRTRLLKEFAVELTLAGVATRIVNNSRELPHDSQFPQALLLPNADTIDAARLTAVAQNAAAHRCWLIFAGAYPDGLPTFPGLWQNVALTPLDDVGIHKFVTATFPDNQFPDDFKAHLLGQTLGFPSALEAALDELVAADQLRIGLQGWELLPGRWKLPVHKHVYAAVTDRIAQLSPEANALLRCFACSLSPLPLAVVEFIVKSNAGADPAGTLAELRQTGWIGERADGLELRHSALHQVLQSLLRETDRRVIHETMHSHWMQADVPDDSVRAEEALFHDFLSGHFNAPAEQISATIKSGIRRGKLAWARTLLEHASHHAPEPHRTVCLIELSRIEYIASDLVRAADILADVTRNGTAPVTPDSLPQFARFANLREKLGHTEQAEQILQRCLPLLDKSTAQVAGSVLGTLAWIEFKRGAGDRARELAESGLMRMPADSTEPDFALLLNTVATLAFYRGDTDVAKLYWQRCLEVFEALGDRKGIANMYNNLGVLAAQSGDRLRARSLWQRCADLSREIDDVHRLAGIYNNLGIDALETGELRAAEDYYLKSLALFRELQSPREQTEILSNLGELAYQRADYTRAMAYLNEAVKGADALDDQELQLEPMIYLGKLLLTLEEIEDSEQVLSSARDIASAVGTRKAEGQAWEGLATLYCRRGEIERAAAAADRAHELLSDEADPLALLHLHLTRCQIAADCGHGEAIHDELAQARKVADTKWDPFTAARTQLTESFFEGVTIDPVQWQVALRKISIYPDLLWKFHWATGRQLAKSGQPKRALDEFGRGVAILKAIASRLPEDRQATFLQAPHIIRFKNEAVELRKGMQAPR